jgi:hypothetical protein
MFKINNNMKTYKVTQENILMLVEHLAILEDSRISKVKEILHTANLVLEILELDQIVNAELEYLKETKLK